jgi:hypothetical protein
MGTDWPLMAIVHSSKIGLGEVDHHWHLVLFYPCLAYSRRS